MSTYEEDLSLEVILIRRIFVTQIALLVTATGLFMFASMRDDNLGFDWMVFLIGCMGGTVSLHRRVLSGRLASYETHVDSWFTTLMPVLYGGVMASVAYLLFLSQVLSGIDGAGLFATNLFPVFTEPSPQLPPHDGIAGITAREFMNLRPLTQSDLGKMWIWSFVAGYSEGFVTKILDQLSSHVGDEAASDEGEED